MATEKREQEIFHKMALPITASLVWNPFEHGLGNI
jgi:hypothetical protein